jgi:tetratricopeptide (TPR) repeat protein
MCLTALLGFFLFTRPSATAVADDIEVIDDDSPPDEAVPAAADEAVPGAAEELGAAAPEGVLDAAAPTTPAVAATKNEKPKENLGQRRQGDVGQNEELSFLQSKVAAQMSELEERMFRLSEALKGLEPENASRLLIGLKYAREELIQLQMKGVQLALSSLKYSDAIVEEKQLLAKLQRLEQLLLSPDLDFQLQLERLRLMRDLMRRLDGAIKEEEREKSATDESAAIEKQLEELREKMATLQEIIKRQTEHIKAGEKLAAVKATDKGPDDPAPAANASGEEKPAAPTVESLTAAQQETREKTKAIEKGVEPIAKAGESMEQAVAGLTKGRIDEALPHQTQALDLLEKALKALQAEEQKLEAALTEEKFSAMRKDQADNRKTTEGISETAVQLGDAGAGARTELIRAAGSMSNAETSFGGRNASAADVAQGEALASLKYAREQLAAEAEKLLNRLRAEIKKRTVEGIAQMLEGQIAVRESTERLGPRVKGGARNVLTAVVALAGSEGKLIIIGEGLTALVEETEFGIALPAALRSVTEGMSEVKERLAAADASEEVVEAEKQIEEDLQALLEAMKQLPSQGDSGRQRAGNASERERQLNRLIAELKMVRMLQVRVGRDTKDVDKKRPADLKDLPAILTKRIESLQGRQEDVHDVTERIAVERGDELQQ